MSIDLDAYFRRIGYSGDRKPTLDTLRALHRLHPQVIAFENLSPLLGHPVPLDADALHAKMVAGGRGGYCFEQNLLFASVLQELDFKLRILTGWPRWGVAPETPRPRTHLLLLIDIDGQEWIADVGFGGNTLTGPLLLRSRDEQVTPHEPARISGHDGASIVQVKIGEQWRDLIAFDLGRQSFAELEMGNWYTSTHPKSRFKNELFAARAEPDRRYGLLGNVLTVHRLKGVSERRRLASASELRDALTDLIRIKLPADPSLDAVLGCAAEASS